MNEEEEEEEESRKQPTKQNQTNRKIFCFPNGDVHHKGITILLQPKKFHTYDQLKTEMSKVSQSLASSFVWIDVF